MNKRSLIICGIAILAILAAFVSLFLERNKAEALYNDLLEGKEPEQEQEQEPEIEIKKPEDVAAE